jgi:lysozyme
MRISQTGIDLIRRHEGLRLKTYVCPGGMPTIGYGHTGSEAFPDNEITADEADKLLRADLMGYEAAIEECVIAGLSQNQFDSLVSLIYNIGAGAFERSTLLRLLNQGDYTGAANQFCLWNKAGGKILPGLLRRRCEEAILFLED